MLLGKPHDIRDASTSAARLLDIDPDHPAIVTGAYIALLLFAVLIHHGAWNGNWREDDFRQLLSVMNHPFWRLLFDPDVWVTFASNAFTPILAGQYLVDLLIFGLNPRGFYLHHVAELAITTIFTYHLLSQRIPRHLSMLATIGFLVAMPTFSVMNFLPNRHYLTGLLLSMASVYLYQRALRENRPRILYISAALFFLAMLAKEIYAVTLLYFLLTSWRTPLFRKVSTLYLLAFVIFAAWRAYILESFIGGHHTEHLFIDRLAYLNHVHRAIFGSDLVTAIFFASVITLILRHRLFDARHLAGLAVLLIAIYLPLLFAAPAFKLGEIFFVMRLSFFPAWLCATGLAYIAMLLGETGARKTATLLLLSFIAITASASALRMDNFRAMLDEHDMQVDFIQNAGPKSALFLSSLIGWDEISPHQRITLAKGHDPAGVILFRDDVFPGFTSYWEYDTRCRCLVQLSDSLVLEKASHLELLNKPRESAPISTLVTWQAHQGLVSIVAEPAGESLCLLSVPGMHFLTACPKSSISLASWIPKDKFALLHAQVFRGRKDDLALATPYMSVPIEGTLQWSRGVFLPSSVQPDGKPTACHIDAPTDRETHLSRQTPLELRGWILGPSITRPDTIPLVILADPAGKLYRANLHREQRPGVKKPGGMVIGAHVLDADLRRVEPGAYHLLLGVEGTICDTSILMTIR